MPKVKEKEEVTCAAHWDINLELWLGRGWKYPHQIGRCRYWNPQGGDHRTVHGRCTKYPEVQCPYRGWRDFTALQESSKVTNIVYSDTYNNGSEDLLI